MYNLNTTSRITQSINDWPIKNNNNDNYSLSLSIDSLIVQEESDAFLCSKCNIELFLELLQSVCLLCNLVSNSAV